MRRENSFRQGARLSNSWLLGMRATQAKWVLSSISDHLINGIGIIQKPMKRSSAFEVKSVII